ncbi:hybrid sensor histidine kinase/response regulator [Geminocystis sp. GBBB08]|uniref:hybrid sensor histidine kinase/response regulator n=1 Tax=Geminocystis sp. GBBB08 TaxID=2604140 RepID=UPI0027E29835|nr:hybrid sensor histidine kinase/response regulator [Geminocystis sp. GBBB08]MBL1210614.1 hybrid sensor histidine kinase/response regulator [Geminocystis sp. GBBB08]
MIQDEELREIYKTSSQEHLQKIETGLLELEKHPETLDSIEEILREAHSLKGDSRIVEVESVENLAHSIEDILGDIKKHELTLTPEISDRLYETLDAMKKLVHEAVTDEPSGINPDSTLDLLLDSVYGEQESFPVNTTFSMNVTKIDPHPVYIEDDELRDIYHITTNQHLDNIISTIEYLENNPQDKAEKFDYLLREIHSVKGDSRIMGVESIAIITDYLETLIKQVEREEISLLDSNGNEQISTKIYQTLDGVREIVTESVTGNPSNINPNELLALLIPQKESQSSVNDISFLIEDIIADDENTIAFSEPDILNEQVNLSPSPSEEISITKKTEPKTVIKNNKSKTFSKLPPQDQKAGEPYKIDTIRVQTRHLDALMTQTGELTVTKIRIAHFASQMEQIANLWEDWKMGKMQKRYRKGNAYLNEDDTFQNRIENLIQDLRSTAHDNSTRLDLIADELESKIKTLRLLPLSNVFNFFPRLVRDLSKQEEKQIELIIEGEETVADKYILEEIKDPLMHMIRNCIDHGLETPAERERQGKNPTGTIWLKGYQTASNIFIEVKDDGRGLDIEKIKETAIRRGMYKPEELNAMTKSQIQSLIFEPGFSTRTFITEVSGRGVGLDVVHTNIERLKGSIDIVSEKGQGTTFRIQIGTTLATANVLLVKIFGITQAIPIEFVQTSLLIAPEDIFLIEGKQTITLDGAAISVAFLSELLELGVSQEENKSAQKNIPCVLIKIGEELFGLLVDEVTDTQDVVIKPQSKLLKRVRNVSGSTILGTGEVCMILNPQDLLTSIQKRNLTVTIARKVDKDKVKERATILLAEDSIATRTQEKRILEGAGFEVITAVDGLDAWHKIKTRQFDAVVSDIQMPNLDGLEFTTKVRQDHQFSELPIILVSSLASDDDRKRGADAGANAYIIKGKFNQDILIETLHRLI